MTAPIQSGACTPSKFPAATTAELIIAYFRSGWAFLIPYLLTYLLYLSQKWPANSFSPSALGNEGYVPALLHVYWALHVIHVTLAAIALRVWWGNGPKGQETGIGEAPKPPTTIDRLWPILPWLMLALIFIIPGVYLEWPSDPWAHLHRIMEWSTHPLVGTHSTAYKSFYFFAYSLLGWLSPSNIFTWLNIYCGALCLVLAWQYYLLAKAVGLDHRWSFLFVLINVFTFGNACFSFCRYYSVATTIFSQVGAVALTRILLETAKVTELSYRDFCRLHWRSRQSTTFYWPRFFVYRLLFSVISLLALIAFNHVQGLGIAGLSIGSIAIWRLLEWKRSTIWWLLALTVILNLAAVLWCSRHPMIEAFYRPSGWLNAWYGFNFFKWPSPAAERAMQSLGLLGLINIGAGIFLLRRNHVAGWLVIGPVIGLALPIFVIPYVNALAAKNPDDIIVYHRMFFAIPSGLALVCLVRLWTGHRSNPKGTLTRNSHFIGAALAIIAGVALTPQRPSNNRFWNALATVPNDLQFYPICESAAQIRSITNANLGTKIIGPGSITYLLSEFGALEAPFARRLTSSPVFETPASNLDAILSYEKQYDASRYFVVVLEKRQNFNSRASQAAQASQHWLPQEALFTLFGGPEVERTTRLRRYHELQINEKLTVLTNIPPTEPTEANDISSGTGTIINK